MNHRLPFKLRTRAIVFATLITALLVAAFVSSVLPTSFAGNTAMSPASTNNPPAGPLIPPPALYSQSNLVSDLPGVALFEDRLLVNPWGVALNSSGAFWVVNNKKDVATIYKGDVSNSPVVPDFPLTSVAILNVPTLVAAPSEPTGVVANTTNDFVFTTPGFSPAPAQYIFVTHNGGINAWHQQQNAVPAVVVKFLSGHRYTGVAIGNNASGNFLYVADFANGKIDVFDKDFNAASVSGNFTDPTVPANFHPYNIHNLGGALYVSYAEFSHLGNDFGFVRKFDTNGVRELGFAINNGPLANPWGMAIAPANYGGFSNLLLVGNNRSLGIHDASINAFNPATGAFVGPMVDVGDDPIEIKGLRALTFGNGVNAGEPFILYFSAGIYNQEHGLFGSLRAVTALPDSLISFSSAEYHTTENAGHFDVTVTRQNDLGAPATVNYATVDSSLTQSADYEIAVGKLTFNPGEASKTFRVLIVDNNLAGGGVRHDLDLVLSNPTGGLLSAPSVAKLFVMDDDFDTNRSPLNIIDDARAFVRQQYFDFLNREPDAAGLDFWTNQITSCGTDQECIERKRVNVSAAFFLSIEFQKTGMLAFLTERTASGTLPRYGSFMRDTQALQKDYVFGAPGAAVKLEANTRAFFDEFVRRPEFVAKYGGLTNDQYVLALLLSGGISTTTGRLFISGVDGSQVVPPVNTPAFGVAIARISRSSIDTVDFSFTLKSPSLPQTAAHLHSPGLAGANAPPIVTLPNGDFRDFTVTLSAQQGADMRSGRFYLDVHTQNNPDGEIRGQFEGLRFQRDVLVDALNDGTITRAEALRLIVEDGDFRVAQLNRAFVLMEYFGYLRRNPDDPPDNSLLGYNFWLAKLDQFNGNFEQADMVKAFINSTEYRRRFGPP